MYIALLLSAVAASSMMGYLATNHSLKLGTVETADTTEVPADSTTPNLTFFLLNPPKFTARRSEIKVVPTSGEVWPKPQFETKLNFYYNVLSDFSIKITHYNCKILEKAVDRFVKVLRTMYRMTERTTGAVRAAQPGLGRLDSYGFTEPDYQGTFSHLSIKLTQPCEALPYHHMDESYTLEVTTTGTLSSGSIWGVLRGLETVSQLFYFSRNRLEIRINATSIVDFPAYPHRGFLLDTARHYVSIETIFDVLDAMAMNKMNVLHWHMVGRESFPYKSKRHPELSEGAMNPSMVYSAADIRRVIKYARMRGIMVYPDINVPGNVNSWAQSHPELVLQCTPTTEVLNPYHPHTFKLLWNLFKELSQIFPDEYFHIGGAVDLYCFFRYRPGSAPQESADFSRRKNGTKLALQSYEKFMTRIMEFMIGTKTLVVAQDVFDNMKKALSKNVVVQVYEKGWIEEMTKLVYSGHRVILSAPWDLEGLHSQYLEQSFAFYYSQHPRAMVQGLLSPDDARLKLILGGEVCLWTSRTRDENIISTAWPRAAAVAETLWSERADPARPTAHTLRRAGEQARRMRRRGLGVGPFI